MQSRCIWLITGTGLIRLSYCILSISHLLIYDGAFLFKPQQQHILSCLQSSKLDLTLNHKRSSNIVKNVLKERSNSAPYSYKSYFHKNNSNGKTIKFTEKLHVFVCTSNTSKTIFVVPT